MFENRFLQYRSVEIFIILSEVVYFYTRSVSVDKPHGFYAVPVWNFPLELPLARAAKFSSGFCLCVDGMGQVEEDLRANACEAYSHSPSFRLGGDVVIFNELVFLHTKAVIDCTEPVVLSVNFNPDFVGMGVDRISYRLNQHR